MLTLISLAGICVAAVVVIAIVLAVLSVPFMIIMGILPWLLTGEDSGRLHGDVDLSARAEEMGRIREVLTGMGLYQKAGDSRFLFCNRTRADHGLELWVGEVPVNIAPFTPAAGGLRQRNFLLSREAGFDALMTATVEGMALEDFVTESTLPDGRRVLTQTAESVRAEKECSGREKDRADLRQLDKLGFDTARYERVRYPIQTMWIETVTRNFSPTER